MRDYLTNLIKEFPLLFGTIIGGLLSGTFLVFAAWLKFRYDKRIQRGNERERALAEHTSNVQAMVEWSTQVFEHKLKLYYIVGTMTSKRADRTENRKEWLDYTIGNWKRMEDFFSKDLEKFINAKCMALKSLIPFDIYFDDDRKYKKLVDDLFSKDHDPLNYFRDVTDEQSFQAAILKDKVYRANKPKTPFVEPANALQKYIFKNKGRWLFGAKHYYRWYQIKKSYNYGS